MITINCEKAEQFSTIFQNIKSISDYITLIFEEHGLYVQGMDNSHISMYEIKLYSTWFDTYKINESKTLCVTSSILQKTLSTKTMTQSITIDIEKDNALIILFESKTKKRKFTIPLINIDSEVLSIPEQEYNVNICIQSKIFKNEIDELIQFSDTTKIICNKDNFVLSINDDECACDTTFPENSCESYETNCETNAIYSLKMLQNFMKFFRLSQNINIHISEEIPILIKYNLQNNSYIKFYLAPKIDD